MAVKSIKVTVTTSGKLTNSSTGASINVGTFTAGKTYKVDGIEVAPAVAEALVLAGKAVYV